MITSAGLKRPPSNLNAGESEMETYLVPGLHENQCPVVEPKEFKRRFGGSRAILIDSGANLNSENLADVKRVLRKYLRYRDDAAPIETASGEIDASKGIRMRISIWDVETDWVAVRDGSPIMSMGERCWENDYTFVWVMRRFPCFLSTDFYLFGVLTTTALPRCLVHSIST